MSTTIQEPPPRTMAARTVFDHVLVGVDGSPEALEAARQAAVLHDGSQLALLSVWSLPPHLVGVTGTQVPYYFDADVERERAESWLARAREAIAPYAPFTAPSSKIARGFAWNELIREAEQLEATLVAVGSHGLGRPRGILSGSTATELLHKCPCSVLVARAATADFPRKIVVGVDALPESVAAYAAARAVATRSGAELWPIAARDDLLEDPVRVLVASAANADLVVVGSRGLHGLASLGSVSERVAHEAPCSVLVVREALWQRPEEGRGR